MYPILVYFELLILTTKKYGPAMTWKELGSIEFQHCGTKEGYY
jgi:hypothetical protein